MPLTIKEQREIVEEYIPEWKCWLAHHVEIGHCIAKISGDAVELVSTITEITSGIRIIRLGVESFIAQIEGANDIDIHELLIITLPYPGECDPKLLGRRMHNFSLLPSVEVKSHGKKDLE